MKLAIRLDCDQTNNILIENLKIFINSEYVSFFQAKLDYCCAYRLRSNNINNIFNVIVFAVIVSVNVIAKYIE